MEDCDVEELLSGLYASLQKLIGLHRQLLDIVRLEREALVTADLKSIQEATHSKQVMISSIHQAESERLGTTASIAAILRKPVEELTLSKLIIQIQASDQKRAEQFRGALNALNILVKRIKEQNDDNKGFVEKSLEHIGAMKRNVLGESVAAAATYSQKGRKVDGKGESRLLSTEG